ncbi:MULTISPECIES: three-Cys-motif partner protein TcmP [Streptosporangium]|uniref:Three-Cys-motif partner protein n=1 Tax=Streptosporangium brasiliense TaxID=47480 RepID=A0ABT9R3T9_9ACTN|nr:three-Cys-motif partner protein TcmP [Streptosporangium brasiliense]MDP9863906.1 three-Cys-motif partner protein [Streptosporangium brasiliense]
MPDKTLWICDPHTVAKHQILRHYLDAWFPILAQARKSPITYVEAFAGPGIYEKGEPGSPVVATEAFLRQRRFFTPGRRVNLILIEERRDRMERLCLEMAQTLSRRGGQPGGMHIEYHNAGYESVLFPAMTRLNVTQGPIFAFLDSFGGPDIPLDVARRIAAVPSSEVLLTFGTRFLIQFGKVSLHQESGDLAFGGQSWREVHQQPSHAKKAFLVSEYRRSLKAAGFKFVISFEMLDEQGHDLHLVFGTSSLKGLEKMKEAMWQVDPVRGVSYRDPRDPDQLAFEFGEHASLAPLRRALLAELSSRDHTLANLREYTLLETVYRPPHATAVVRQLLKDGSIERDPIQGQLSEKTLIRVAVPRPLAPVQDRLF